jgi:hypothetical protein
MGNQDKDMLISYDLIAFSASESVHPASAVENRGYHAAESSAMKSDSDSKTRRIGGCFRDTPISILTTLHVFL